MLGLLEKVESNREREIVGRIWKSSVGQRKALLSDDLLLDNSHEEFVRQTDCQLDIRSLA